mmetsp:Transcript_45536/g.138398  ORF Transcript_45536/g.138398 Transcript_45536/m.138398 type:complete len:450 (-) Transcript_45536:791-2140(-)
MSPQCVIDSPLSSEGFGLKSSKETAPISSVLPHEDLSLGPLRDPNCMPRYPCAVVSQYINLLQKNHGYCLYLASHICQHAGDWFVHIAALLVVERLAPGSASALSTLVLTKTLPLLLLSPIGGALADTFDRRRLMIILDIVSAVVVLGYLVALALNNIAILYITSTLRSSVLSIYEPVTRSIVPLIVTDATELKKAVTLNGVAWSVMIMIGGVVAGYASSHIGIEACFVIDSITYLLSAYVISLLEGKYSVGGKCRGVDGLSTKSLCGGHFLSSLLLFVRPLGSFVGMTRDLISYLWVCGFGLLTMMKSSGSLTWGAADILNVSFAKVEGDEAATGQRLGLIYTSIGIGCLVGPIVTNLFTDPNRPSTLQSACICALALMSLGWIGLSSACEIHSSLDTFPMVCVFTMVRTLGSSTIWMNSTMILQVSQDCNGVLNPSATLCGSRNVDL